PAECLGVLLGAFIPETPRLGAAGRALGKSTGSGPGGDRGDGESRVRPEQGGPKTPACINLKERFGQQYRIGFDEAAVGKNEPWMMTIFLPVGNNLPAWRRDAGARFGRPPQ